MTLFHKILYLAESGIVQLKTVVSFDYGQKIRLCTGNFHQRLPGDM